MVKRVADYASRETGMDVRVDRLRLSFPLDLSLQGVSVADAQGDTLLRVEDLTVDVYLATLFRGSVKVETLELNRAYVDTKDLISGLGFKGGLERFTLDTDDINLAHQRAMLNRIRLETCQLEIALGADTAQKDTASSPVNWILEVKRAEIADSRLRLRMPGDSMVINAALTDVALAHGFLDLGEQLYRAERFDLKSDSLRYDLPYQPVTTGLDVNHLGISNIDIRIDSVEFRGENTALAAVFRHATMKEKSGLVLSDLTGHIRLDSASLFLPDLELRTPDSQLRAQAEMDWHALTPQADGTLAVRLSADLGKQDLLLFAGGLPQAFVRAYPNRPVRLRLSADGNMNRVMLNRLDVRLEDVFELEADGTLTALADADRRQADVRLAARTKNLDMVKALAGPAAMRDVALPPMQLDGRLQADGSRYTARMDLKERSGKVSFNGSYDTRQTAYDAEVKIKNLQLHHFLPKDSLYKFTATASARGVGTDVFSTATRLAAQVHVAQLEYGSLDFNNVNLKGALRGGKGHIDFDSANGLLQMTAQADALLRRKSMGLTFGVDLHYADLYAMRLTPRPLRTSMCLHMDGSTNLKNTHSLQGNVSDLTFLTADTVFRPRDLDVNVLLRPDTVYAYLTAGDFLLNVSGQGGYEKLLKQADKFAAELSAQAQNKRIDQNGLKAFLPKVNVKVRSGQDNPVCNYLASLGYQYNQLNLDLKADPEVGLNGGGHVFRLNTGAMLLDTIQWHVYQDTTGVKMDGRVRNGPKNKQFVFDARLTAYLHDTGAGCNLVYWDEQWRKGVDIGARADLEADGVRIRFSPLNPIIAYRHFRLNEDNYFFLGNNTRVEADIDLLADDGTGVKIYSTPNEDALQDVSVSVNRLNLGELTSVIPYAPRITGFLQGDVHLVQTTEHLSVVADMNARDLVYEEARLGQIGMNAVYLPNADGTHFVDGRVTREGEDMLALSGTYADDGHGGQIDAQVDIIRLPLALANGFVPDGLVALAGYTNGSVRINGPSSNPIVDGVVALDSVRINSPAYSLKLRIADDSVRIRQSDLQMKDLKVYSLNDNPLVINGNVDFSRFDNIRLNTRIASKNFELINAQRTQKALAYGKVYVDFNTRLSGTLDNLLLRGQLKVLGNTDVTYVLKDSPLTVEDRLSGLVTFVDFSDSTNTDGEKDKARPMNLDMVMQVSIDQAAQVHCMLSEDRSNYVDIEGGGDLTLVYTPVGDLKLNGRYTVLSGEMKYSWFVIPLKTFTLKSGSYVEFTGDVANPTLNISATEHVRATVTEDSSPRTVAFDVGLSITQNLENMGLQFTLDAPEDMTIQNDLAAMSAEQRGRLAVTMLATGMYLVEGNSSGGGFNTQNALNALLQSEIKNIAGNALKTIDVSLGVENATSADGDTHTDYSFRFAKRFWGNRISVIIGGKVSTGNEAENIGQTLIDNVSLEYRLDESATRYVKVFYDRNYESLLEGNITEMGAGLVLRRKTARLGELFLFRKRGNGPGMQKEETNK
mgnify:FL=1